MTNEELETRLLQVEKDHLAAVNRLDTELLDLKAVVEIQVRIIKAIAKLLPEDKSAAVAAAYRELWGKPGTAARQFEPKQFGTQFPFWLARAIDDAFLEVRL